VPRVHQHDLRERQRLVHPDLRRRPPGPLRGLDSISLSFVLLLHAFPSLSLLSFSDLNSLIFVCCVANAASGRIVRLRLDVAVLLGSGAADEDRRRPLLRLRHGFALERL
jgi:hypothetical protein